MEKFTLFSRPGHKLGLFCFIHLLLSLSGVYANDKIVAPAMADCGISATVSAQSCFNFGTSNASDDKITFTLTVSSTGNVGGFVSVFDGATNLGGQGLNTPKEYVKQFFISELPKTLTIKAGDGSACEITVTINPIATCSPVCIWDPSNINPPYASSTINRDCKGTADESDDTVSGVFSVSGTPAGYDWDLDIKLNETGTQKQLVSTQSYTVTSVPWGPISVSALKSGYPAGNGFVLWFMVTGITDCLGDLFIAFPDCSTVTPACGLSMTPTAGICQTATNTFSSTVVVRVTNTNAGGVLTVTDGNSSQTLTVGASLSSFIGTAVFNNLTSNGSSHLVSASLAGCSSQTASYNAPASCTVCSLSLIASVLANGQIGTAYSQTISVTGSTGSLIFSSTGNLPTGLSLNTSTGVISGTPISATTTSFTVKVTDGKNCSAVAPLTITTSAAPVCSLTATATPGVCNLVTNQYTVTGTVSATNAPASQTLTISVNGITTSVILTDNDPASYTLTGLTSDGLAKTISVVSTATACGQASVTYTAPASCSVAPPRMVVVVGTPICNTLNNTYTVTGTVSFTNIPDGILTLTDNTVQAGIISITANQPSATFTLTGLSGTSPAVHQVVADINGGNGPMVASTTYATPASCTVCSLSVTTASLPNGQVGTAYSQTITTTGGTVPLIFSTLGGTLPAGLQLTANGVISGTPTTSGAASFTVEVTDGKNCSAVAPLTITTSTVPVCGLNLTVTPGLCNSATNRYTLTGQVSATNVPASGTLTVSSAAFSPAFTRTIPSGTSSGNFSFSGLVSNGQTFVVTASFSDTACTPVSQTFVAPASCSVAPICSLTLTPTAGICQTATNTFSSTVTVRIANTNAGGVLTVTDGGISQTLSVGANLSSFTGTAVFNGLPSDGSNRPVSASLSGCGSTTAAYNAPEACTVATPCSVSLTVNKGICDPITNTFSATATLTASNVQPPRSVTVDVGGQTGVFNLTATGTNTIILVVALPSDGATKTATATFAGTACAQTSTTFAAPMACTVCSMSVTPTAGPCRRTTNTFSSTVTVRITTTGSGGVLTVTDGPISQTLNVLAGVINYVGTAIFNNLPSNGSSHTVTASLPGCSSMTASYNAPTSCSMSFDLDKQARIDRGEIGGTISYTVNVVNSGPESITSLVISDTYTAGITIIPSSISTSHGSYTPGLTGGDWAIANLAPGATATLTYSASILAEGVVYNTAFTSTTSVQVCSSIPFKVCKGESFAIALTVPSGFNRYQWYLTPPGTNSRTLVADGTLASFTATLPGIYEVVVNEGLANQCAQGTCCPIIIEEIEVPSYTAVGTAPTCQGTTPQANGKITLTGLGADPTRYSYQVSPGSTFSVMQATPGSAIPVPANGVVATNLSEGTYTVRVYALINGEVACSRDFTVTLTANCTCPEEVCVPITIRKIRR
jgi:trimeric autotransporter adhesin